MHTVDSQLVPAILLVMIGPAILFFLWVFCNLQREIERSRTKRVSLSRVTDLRGQMIYLRRVQHKKRLSLKPSIPKKTELI